MQIFSCTNIWENEFDNIVSKKHKVQGLNNNQL